MFVGNIFGFLFVLFVQGVEKAVNCILVNNYATITTQIVDGFQLARWICKTRYNKVTEHLLPHDIETNAVEE